MLVYTNYVFNTPCHTVTVCWNRSSLHKDGDLQLVVSIPMHALTNDLFGDDNICLADFKYLSSDFFKN